MYSAGARGLGDAPIVAQKVLSTGASVASGIAMTIAATGPWGAVAAGVLEVGSLIAGLFETSLTGKQKIATTQIVNQVEPYLKQNLAAYQADPTVANQQAALANFDAAWAGVVQACNQSQYGQPGQNCIADRNRGGKWDWFAMYRDPIANSTPIDSVSSAGVAGSVAVAGVSIPVPLLIGGGLLLVAVMS